MGIEGKKDEPQLETMFESLEQTISVLEAEDITLDAAFLAYTEGMKTLKQCNDIIDKVEKKVMTISEDGDLTEF